MPNRSQGPALDDVDRLLAARLRQRRLELDLEPRLLDLAIGESPGTVAKFEAGDRRMCAAHIYRLGDALGVPPEYFYAGGSDAPPSNAAAEPGNGHESGNGSRGRPDPHLVAEAKRFAKAYTGLKDPTVRRTVANLIRSLADTCGNGRGEGGGNGTSGDGGADTP